MRTFIIRHPLVFSLLLTLALFGLLLVSRAVLSTAVVSSVADLSPKDLERPSEVERALSVIASSETLFWALTALLAIVLLAWLGWWREAGFEWPLRWRNLYLLPFLLLVLALSGGVRVPGPVLLAAALFGVVVTVFGEEAIYRGIVWRALAPKMGVVRTVVATALLSGLLHFGRVVSAGPWPEALYVAVLATCGGFAYAALRWHAASIWPAILSHFAFGLAGVVSRWGAVLYLVLLLASTLVFIGYGRLRPKDA